MTGICQVTELVAVNRCWPLLTTLDPRMTTDLTL